MMVDVMDNTVKDLGIGYEVERSHRLSKNLFPLIDDPVTLSYDQATLEDDYSETKGRFLNSVVMGKVIDGGVQRFFSDQKPYKLECFNRSDKKGTLVDPRVLPQMLAELFHMPQDKIIAALTTVSAMADVLQ
jgi:hypothetical protein